MVTASFPAGWLGISILEVASTQEPQEIGGALLWLCFSKGAKAKGRLRKLTDSRLSFQNIPDRCLKLTL